MSTIPRATFIALRARRQAHQIASEILNPSLDLKQLYCRQCGTPLRTDRLDRHDGIACHYCGNVTTLPHYMAERIRTAIPMAAPSPDEVAQWEVVRARRARPVVRWIALFLLAVMLVGFTIVMLAFAMQIRAGAR